MSAVEESISRDVVRTTVLIGGPSPLERQGPRASRHGLRGREHEPAALAEADRREPPPQAPPAHPPLVAVLQESAGLSAGERERLGAAPGELEEAAAILLRGPRDRPARPQIARPQGAPVARVGR